MKVRYIYSLIIHKHKDKKKIGKLYILRKQVELKYITNNFDFLVIITSLHILNHHLKFCYPETFNTKKYFWTLSITFR